MCIIILLNTAYLLLSTFAVADVFYETLVPDPAFALWYGQRGSIHCGEGTKIKILSANYGRTDGDICPGGNTAARTCRSKTALNRVKWNCNGYRICHLYASNHFFGNPYVNISKYLEVKYRCEKNRMVTAVSIVGVSIIVVHSIVEDIDRGISV